MTDRFYVIYSPNTAQYLNTENGLGGYDAATQFGSHDDAKWELAGDYPADFKIVGPCIEWEQP